MDRALYDGQVVKSRVSTKTAEAVHELQAPRRAAPPSGCPTRAYGLSAISL